ncbi:MAG: type II toxin-antitoxin system RelE/ParE family toxin [Lentisphaeraceae bacterium]|nr:type II toxin-antitoxin system RelE/ParE family toxin [Lentisphaeraceae bacterium]
MAEVVWAETALSDLNTIAEYIALDKPIAASKYVEKVFSEVDLLADFPTMGKLPKELPKTTVYRELVIKPCRVFYRQTKGQVFIVHIMRGEQLLRLRSLER